MENQADRKPTAAEREAALTAASRYRHSLETMSQIESIGAILGRAQIIEEIMRRLIACASETYTHPEEVAGTFGRLLSMFRTLYPDEAELLGWLEAARVTRNRTAHDSLVTTLTIREMLSDDDPEAVDRYLRRGFRKNIEGMDMTLAKIARLLEENPVEFGPWSEELDP